LASQDGNWNEFSNDVSGTDLSFVNRLNFHYFSPDDASTETVTIRIDNIRVEE
jgi:hypothetical protein